MIAERRKILTMLHEHKINVDEAEGLMNALEHAPEPAPELKVEIITANPKLQKVLDDIKKIAPSSSTVLIIGESGTGKELIARAIHQDSPRRDKPFIPANCAAMPVTLLESKLFGHERGAFTGANSRKIGLIEQANDGTLFLVAIDELPMELQVKLLRFADVGEFIRIGGTQTIQADVRLIAATNKNLWAEVKENRFREDLYYRLNVISIESPPLRERMEDIPPLVDYFLEKYATRNNRAIPTVAQEAMNVLMAYNWPGNVRELCNVIERAVVLCDGDTIQVEHLPEALTKPTLVDIEKEAVANALQEAGGNKAEAAKRLNIPLRGLYRKISEFHLEPSETDEKTE